MTAAAQATHTELHTLLATQRGRVVARLARSWGLAHLAQAGGALQAPAPPADGAAFPANPGIDHFVFNGGALRAAHDFWK